MTKNRIELQEQRYDNAYALWWRAEKVLAHAKAAGSFEGISLEQAKLNREKAYNALIAAEKALGL